MMAKKMNAKISERLDDIKIKQKLIIIFVFCVLLPVVSLDIVVYGLVSRSLKKDSINEMKNTAQRLEYNIFQTVGSALNVAQQFQKDKVLDDFLNTHYQDNLDYYINYNRLMKDNVFSYYYQSESVYKISIFTNNQSVTRSSSFYSIKEAKEEEWYKLLVANKDKNFLLHTYYSNKSIRAPFDDLTHRKISIVSKFAPYEGIVKFLKVDISYHNMQNLVFNEKSVQDIIITRGDDVLFDTRGVGSEYLPIRKLEPLDKKLLKTEREVKVVGENWKIIVTREKNNFMDTYRANNAVMWFIIVINLIFPSFIIFIMGSSLTRRVKLTDEYLNKVKDGEYHCIPCYEGKDEIGKMIGSYNIMVNRVRELIEVVLKGEAERNVLEISKKQAELNALQSQVNPHFMFNALESIRMKSLLNGEKETANIIGELAKHMRSTIRWEVDFVTIGDEMAFIKSYLEIQKYRFGDRLDYSIYVQKECEQLRIPKFGILTFVENSCVHGIERKIEGGSVNIIVMREADNMFVEIMDSGIGMDEDKLKELRIKMETASMENISLNSSIGIMNAYIRLKIYYQEKIECQIESKINEGTDVYLTVLL